MIVMVPLARPTASAIAAPVDLIRSDLFGSLRFFLERAFRLFEETRLRHERLRAFMCERLLRPLAKAS